MLEVKDIYGLVVIERKEATIGLLIGKKIKLLQNISSFVPGKIRAGGQSSQRFHRITEGLAKDFYRKVADLVKKEFFNQKDKLKGILIGGPGPTKEEFLKEGQLVTALKDKILAIKDIGYADEHGLELLVNCSQDVLSEQEIYHEKEILENFFNKLGKDKDKTAYGKEPVLKALDYGAVETLLLSKKLDKKELKEFEKKAQETSTKVELISNDTSEGVQFFNLGGIGAILRYKIQ
jgi:peptide chain release factor subunit 1